MTTEKKDIAYNIGVALRLATIAIVAAPFFGLAARIFMWGAGL